MRGTVAAAAAVVAHPCDRRDTSLVVTKRDQ